jgi:hypothetical protein
MYYFCANLAATQGGTLSRSEKWRLKIAARLDMLMMTGWNNRNFAVPLSQLKSLDVDESTTQAIEDWHYWIAQGYCF